MEFRPFPKAGDENDKRPVSQPGHILLGHAGEEDGEADVLGDGLEKVEVKSEIGAALVKLEIGPDAGIFPCGIEREIMNEANNLADAGPVLGFDFDAALEFLSCGLHLDEHGADDELAVTFGEALGDNGATFQQTGRAVDPDRGVEQGGKFSA